MSSWTPLYPYASVYSLLAAWWMNTSAYTVSVWRHLAVRMTTVFSTMTQGNTRATKEFGFTVSHCNQRKIITRCLKIPEIKLPYFRSQQHSINSLQLLFGNNWAKKAKIIETTQMWRQHYKRRWQWWYDLVTYPCQTAFQFTKKSSGRGQTSLLQIKSKYWPRKWVWLCCASAGRPSKPGQVISRQRMPFTICSSFIWCALNVKNNRWKTANSSVATGETCLHWWTLHHWMDGLHYISGCVCHKWFVYRLYINI